MKQSDGTKSFAEILEEEWIEQSEELEEKHFDAAFDAKIAEIDSTTTEVDRHHRQDLHSDTTFDNDSSTTTTTTTTTTTSPIIKKSNCYSPYVPSSAIRIQAMIDLVQFRPGDIFCDMGCGDGRVCVVVANNAVVSNNDESHHDQSQAPKDVASSRGSFRAIGIDVSQDCIDTAQQHLMNQQHIADNVKNCIQFYQADLTISPDELLRETSPLRHELLSVTVIYLYTYPTLLVQLIPLLTQLFQIGQLRVVVTLTYHLQSTNNTTTTGTEQRHWTCELDCVNEPHDLCRYTHISLHPATSSNVTAMTEGSEQ